MTSDLDVYRAANQCIQQHGDAAVEHARRRVAELRASGEWEGAEVWQRIIVAIDTLQSPRSGLPS